MFVAPKHQIVCCVGPMSLLGSWLCLLANLSNSDDLSLLASSMIVFDATMRTRKSRLPGTNLIFHFGKQP